MTRATRTSVSRLNVVGQTFVAVIIISVISVW